jgi:hypothetical protein
MKVIPLFTRAITSHHPPIGWLPANTEHWFQALLHWFRQTLQTKLIKLLCSALHACLLIIDSTVHGAPLGRLGHRDFLAVVAEHEGR